MTNGFDIKGDISTPSNAAASTAAYGPAGDFNVSYGTPVTLGGLVGDTKSMVIAAVLLIVALKFLRRKKG